MKGVAEVSGCRSIPPGALIHDGLGNRGESACIATTGGYVAQIDGSSDIEEIKILGEWAFMRTKLRVVVTPPAGAPSIERAGHTLTILQKRNGKWLLARDANLLAAVPK